MPCCYFLIYSFNNDEILHSKKKGRKEKNVTFCVVAGTFRMSRHRFLHVTGVYREHCLNPIRNPLPVVLHCAIQLKLAFN